MENTLAYLIAGGFFLVIFILFFLNRKSRMNSEWSGIVTDKNSGLMGIFGGGFGMLNANCTLTVKITDGNTKTIYVTQGVYDQFKVGDKITKHKGETNPTK